jgi:hypothetical protein
MLGKLNRYLAGISIFLLVAALVAGMAGCDGGGFSQNLEIRDWYDLDDVRYNLGGNHKLMNDLDSTTRGYEELASPTANGGKGWEQIGGAGAYDQFTGAFHGQGYEIRDLFINRPDDRRVGLFGRIGHGGIVEDVSIVNVTVMCSSYADGLVAAGEPTVSNRPSLMDVGPGTDIGALVGSSDGTVINCYSSGTVSGDDSVGGLVGDNQGTVSDSYSTANVTGYWMSICVGGLVGFNTGTVSSSYASGNVTGEDLVGGLVGHNGGTGGGTVCNSYATGSVTGYSGVGGLLGSNSEGTVSDSYSRASSVTGSSGVGGLVGGGVLGSVSNCYYNYDEVLINGQNMISTGALFDEDFEEWLANDKFLDVNDRLSQDSGYYLINNVSDFKQLLAFGQNATLRFRLANDLDFAAEPNFYIPYFAGEFDGNGNKISNLSLDLGLVSPLGLFGHLAPDGRITDLGVENVNITGGSLVGGLAGENIGGTVSNCYSTGSVSGEEHVGGLVGWNYYGSALNPCSSTVSNSYSSANVTGDTYVGGLLGRNLGLSTVLDSYSTGRVTGSLSVGGLLGLYSEGTISNSFWDTQTSGQTTSGGGIGKTTTEMQSLGTFSFGGWDIMAVALNETNPAYIWNIVNGVTYPFLSWQSV